MSKLSAYREKDKHGNQAQGQFNRKAQVKYHHAAHNLIGRLCHFQEKGSRGHKNQHDTIEHQSPVEDPMHRIKMFLRPVCVCRNVFYEEVWR